MPISWTDGTAVDGTTILNSARWEQLKTDIAAVTTTGGVDSAMLASGSVTRAKMASGNQDVVQAVTIPLNDEVVLTSRIGFSQGTADKEFYGFTAKTAGTIVGVDYAADTVDSQNCKFQVAVAGSAQSATLKTISTGTAPQTDGATSLSIAVTLGQRIGIIVAAASATTNVAGAHAIVYFQRTLA